MILTQSSNLKRGKKDETERGTECKKRHSDFRTYDTTKLNRRILKYADSQHESQTFQESWIKALKVEQILHT